jgi:hypothetical protein
MKKNSANIFPQDGDTYYMFNRQLKLVPGWFHTNSLYDYENQKSGNFFRTKAECRKVIKDIKNIIKLRKLWEHVEVTPCVPKSIK